MTAFLDWALTTPHLPPILGLLTGLTFMAAWLLIGEME